MKSKRQQTIAKIKREQAVKERRARKLEKKHAAPAPPGAESAEDTSVANTSEEKTDSG